MSTPKNEMISPAALCHVVLRTSPENYDNMITWYLTFLGGRITHGDAKLTLIAYDHEHHRVAIIATPNVASKKILQASGKISSLAHFAFGYRNLADLATQYEQKKASGLKPSWVVNHGMSTSMYWHDPDGNECETQVDNFDTTEEAIQFMKSDEFFENPYGVEFDPDEFVAKVRSGFSESELKKRPNIGPRASR